MSGAPNLTGVGAGSDEWRTPPDLFARLNRTFHFDYDAFANHENALCKVYSTVEGTFLAGALPVYTNDGLAVSWRERRVWMNPPYSRGFIAEAMTKAAMERNNAQLIVALIPANTDTRWWHDVVVPNASHIEFLRGRVRFLRPDGTPGDAPPNGSALVYYFPDCRS